MTAKKIINMVNRDKKLAFIFGGMVFDCIVLISLILLAAYLLP